MGSPPMELRSCGKWSEMNSLDYIKVGLRDIYAVPDKDARRYVIIRGAKERKGDGKKAVYVSMAE